MSSRPSHQETEVELDRESVATTLFSSQSSGNRDRQLNFVHALRDRENLQKILERKVDSAVQGEKEAQQILYQAEAEIEAKNWEKRKIWISAISATSSELMGQIRLNEIKVACMENWIWEMDSSKRIMQGIAKKLENWEELLWRNWAS